MKHSLRVGKHLPLHFKELYPKMVTFVETYYEFMEKSGFVDNVIRGRIQSGDTTLVRDDADAFIATLEERLSGINTDTADVEVADYRAPEWWSNNMMSILNMERIPESLMVSDESAFTTKDGETFQSNFVHRQTVDNWMKDSGFPDAGIFGGDSVLTSRILRSLYQLKGSTKALELFFNVFYGEDVNIINPNKLIARLDDNFILDSNVQIKDDIIFSEFGIIVQSAHPREYYEPLFSDVYLKMFHPAGFGVNFVEGEPDETPEIAVLNLSLNKAYAIGISNTGVLNVNGVQGGNGWEYTTDYGSKYKKGFGASFQLPEGNYSLGRIGARQVTPSGKRGELTFMDDFMVEVSSPSLTVETDTEYKRIRGNTIPRVSVTLKRYNGDIIQTTKSDSNGIYRFVFKDGIPRGEYAVEVISLAGNISVKTIDINYRDIDYPVPLLRLHSDTGLSSTDLISKDGRVDITNTQGYAWEYSVDGGYNWNDGSGEYFRLKHGSYSINSVMARTKQGLFHGRVGTINRFVKIVLLKPKIAMSLVGSQLHIESKDVTTISIFKNTAYLKTVDLVKNVYKLEVELVDWDNYTVKAEDVAGNKVEADYTIQII